MRIKHYLRIAGLLAAATVLAAGVGAPARAGEVSTSAALACSWALDPPGIAPSGSTNPIQSRGSVFCTTLASIFMRVRIFRGDTQVGSSELSSVFVSGMIVTAGAGCVGGDYHATLEGVAVPSNPTDFGGSQASFPSTTLQIRCGVTPPICEINPQACARTAPVTPPGAEARRTGDAA